MISDNADDIQAEIDQDKMVAVEYLLHYNKLSQKYLADKERFLSRSRNFLGVRNAPADPTAALAMQSAVYDLASDEYYWLRAVEIVESGLSEHKKKLLMYRRQAGGYRVHKRGRPGWTAYTQSRLYCSESALKWQWQKIVMQTVLTYGKLRQQKYL